MRDNFQNNSFLFGANAVFVEELYELYQQDPDLVDKSWQDFFAQQANDAKGSAKTIAKIIGFGSNLSQPESSQVSSAEAKPLQTECDLKAKFMINAYRQYGHYLAKLDPLELEINKTREELRLNIEDFGFTKEHMDFPLNIQNEFSGIAECSIGQLYNKLNETYASSIGVEFSHVESIKQQQWLYEQLETAHTHTHFTDEQQRKFLQNLVEVESFEQYIHTKFPGAKRFSIEGGEAAISSLNYLVEEAAKNNCQEVVFGLAHRGRLATLTNVMGKPYRAIFAEFKGESAFPADLAIAGDVKYHMGYSNDRVIEGVNMHLSLTPNPSHLEAVNTVVAGKVRAKQDHLERNRRKVMGVLIHGDAAFCGQGVVAEGLVMSDLEPYETGGLFHLVINNQIGFTANAHDGRPGRYCTEVAKMVGAPILHVNGEDIWSVMLATKIASDYRAKFGKDVVLDIVCYRKYGHNEGDEPMYTQAVMYNVIKNKATPANIYANSLVAKGIISENYYDEYKQQCKARLDAEYQQIDNYQPQVQWLEGKWQGLKRDSHEQVVTGIAKQQLQDLTNQLCIIPEEFALNRKLAKLFQNRLETVQQDQPIDWATAEQLAFATLLLENTPIRITGQDAGRGTFSHRHAVLHSQEDGSTYTPLNNLANQPAAKLEIADSNLSEYGVLGFEYGYSWASPHSLVIWEAQFGDFSNGAQIIFDQFIASAETKWLRMSGLVCLLPHGMEGQGPEHSSARLERLLQLCADNNMQVVYPTTPASIFHLLRRQIKRDFRKPLMVMSPKSLLRHKLAVSQLSELAEGTRFLPVIDEIDAEIKPTKVKKIIFCAGKVYYDLLEERRNQQITNIAIIRLEQLYPLPAAELKAIISKYNNIEQIVWVQEEHKNMGSWSYIEPELTALISPTSLKLEYVGREPSASPAVGYSKIHNAQQADLVSRALNLKHL